MADTFPLFNSALAVYAKANEQKKITNVGGGSLYYKTTSAVSTSDSSIASGSSITIQQPYWIIAANGSPCNVLVQTADEANLRSEVANSQPKAIKNGDVTSATTPGTDTACTNGTAYVSDLYVPCDFLVTGVGYLVGSAGGTDKVIVSIWDNAGNVLGNSATAGTTVGTAAQSQAVALTATQTLPGKANYWVGLTFNGTTAKFRSYAAYTHSGRLGNGVTQTFGTVAAITPPSTFTADKVPYLYIY